MYKPISIPEKPWSDISMDFVLGLPKIVKGCYSIFVIFDIFSKMAHFIPCKKKLDVEHVAKIFFKDILNVDPLKVGRIIWMLWFREKMAHFIPCKKTSNAKHVAEIFFK